MINWILSNIAIVISVISLVLSLYNFFHSIYVERKKLTINLFCYEKIKFTDHLVYTFKTIIENNSRLPVSITNISLDNTNCEYSYDYIFKKSQRHGNIVVNEDKFYGIQLPVNLSALMSISCLIRFNMLDEIDFDNFTLKINTNRGAIKNANVIFHSDFHQVEDIL